MPKLGTIIVVIVVLLSGNFAWNKTQRTPEKLAGRDMNRNGIRDDVDSYIFATWNDPKEKAMVQQYARAMQAVMMVYQERRPSVIKEKSAVAARALRCMKARRGEQGMASMVDPLHQVMFNDRHRRAVAEKMLMDHVLVSVAYGLAREDKDCD